MIVYIVLFFMLLITIALFCILSQLERMNDNYEKVNDIINTDIKEDETGL